MSQADLVQSATLAVQGKYLHITVMTGYKFSQAVTAICQTADSPEHDVTFRLKRLLALDRKLGYGPRAAGDAERRFAFYGEKPQGKGVDVLFSGYEAFALFLANSMIEAGFPQLTVVELLRRARPQLAKAHKRCSKKNAAALFDETAIDLYLDLWGFGSTDPTVLLIAGMRDTGPDGVRPFAVCSTSNERYDFARKWASRPGTGLSTFPLARAAHNLAKHLADAPLRHRGRRAGS